MPEELDPFDAAGAEALAEVDSEVETVEQGHVETDTPQATETVQEAEEVAPAVDAVVPPTTEEVQPVAETPWWESRLDEVIEYKGVSMPLREALANGLRQADYTRKTQELARKAQLTEWAEALVDDLRADPVAGMRRLAEQLKLIPQGQQDYDPAEDPDPAMVELSQVRSEIEELRQARLVEEARREIAEVRSKYPDFSDDALALVAEYGNNGVGLSIEEGYWLWKGQQSVKAEAAAAAARERAAQEAQRLEAARKAATVAPGHSPAATLTEELDLTGLSGDEIFDAIAEATFGSLYNDD